ncbi:methionine ABC transporter ATP-binding protein [Aquamicrobium segne]|uniref:Methionine ABC transporter ATP-binding protein n=1 Tax=Aquamicrobium segne TaxID=469547 RepID=A0ABW0GYX3_9HYPH
MNQHVDMSASGDKAARQATGLVGEPVVRLVDVKRHFGKTAALDGVSLSVGKGEIIGIIGRSGAGKSTLIRCLNGLERPDSGEVHIEGREIGRLDEKQLQPLRRRIGMIFQHFNLLSAKTVEENVALPLKIAGVSSTDRLRRAGELLELVGLSGKARAYPASLSGGQKQRVGIARALAAEPALLLSDEATSALDPETTRSILALLREINRQLGLTIILITHEMEVVRSIADRVAVIDAGRIIEEGPVWKVFADPQEEITKSLLQGMRPQLPLEFMQKLSPNLGSEAVLRVDIVGETALGPLLADLGAQAGTFRFIHGGIEQVQGHAVGTLFLAVSAGAPDLSRTMEFLTGRGARIEVLGYVFSDD